MITSNLIVQWQARSEGNPDRPSVNNDQRESFVEKDPEGFDVAVPLHDATGAIIGTVGMDFKAEAGLQKSFRDD